MLNTKKNLGLKFLTTVSTVVMVAIMTVTPVLAEPLTADQTASLKSMASGWADSSAIPSEYKYDSSKASTIENKVMVKLGNGEDVIINGDAYASKSGNGNKGTGAAGAAGSLGGDKGQNVDTVKGNVDNIMNEVTITADTAGAGALLSGFQAVIGLVIGILAYLIVLGLPLFSAVDIAYITIPVLREKADDAKDNHTGGQGNAMVKSNGKFRFISDEAVYACKAASMDEGKGALGIYFKKRVGTYIVCAIVLYLLISGNIQVITQIAVNLVSGIVGVIERLGQ